MAETAKKPMNFTKEWESLRQAYFLDAVRESKGSIYLAMEQTDLSESAMDVGRICAEAILAPLPKPYSMESRRRTGAYQDNWESEYTKWLTIATQHALQAGVMGRDG